MSAVIVADALTKRFGERAAVDGLSFTVEPDRGTGFLGANGAGKTTTLRMLLGLATPTSGESRVLGSPYAGLPRPGSAVGALLETHQFHPKRSARNHLRAYADAMSLPSTRVEEVLDLVELAGDAHRKVGTFSLGMRQRLGLATALLGDPRLLVLDEPANGLDPAGIRWLRTFLRGFAVGGRAAFLSSHQLGEVAQMADEVVVIDAGRLVVHARVTALLEQAGQGVRVRTDQPERLREALCGQRGLAEMTSHDTLLVRGLTAEVVGRTALAAGVPVFGLEAEDVSLEDVFLQLTGAQARP